MSARATGRLDGQLRACPYFGEIERLLEIAPRCSWRAFASGTDAERWRRAKSWIIRGYHAATVLRIGADPAALRWPPGSAIVDVSDQAGALVQRLAQSLIRDHVTHALFVDLGDPTRSFHCKRSPQAVAA